MFRKKISEEKRLTRVKNRRVHMSNERTFLAWIRTSIGIMAFGFVIEKFFTSAGSNTAKIAQGAVDGFDYYALLGIFVVLLGAVAGLLATYRFLRTEKEITEDTYRPSVASDVLVAVLLVSIGMLLFIYLIKTL